MEKYDATWRDAGRLAKLETDFSGGVYLFVHEGHPRRIIYEPLFSDSPSYEQAWKPWVISEYLGKVSVWRCTLPSDKLSVILESKIQLAVRARFEISYYRASGVQS